MSHEQFCTEIRTRLVKILSSNDSLISKEKPEQFEEHPKIFISIRRFDHSVIDVQVSEDARVFQLKKSIQMTFSNEKINWKFIWKKYTLATSDHRYLSDNNRKIKSYGIGNHAELSFVRERRFK